MKKYHYVYKITNLKPQDERKYYIGVRSSKLKPEEDTKYQSSSKYLKQALKEIGHNNFKKEILSIWNTRKEANQEEIRLHELYDVAKNQNYYNKARATSTKFCTEGQVTVIDIRDGMTKNVTKEEFNQSDYFIAITKGQVTVLDARDGKTKNVSKEEFTSFEYYQSIAKNTITVLDIRDNVTKRVSRSDFNKYDYYVSVMKNTINVRDLISGENRRIPLKEYYNDMKRYEFILKGTISVFDTTTNETKRVTVEDYKNNNNFINLNSQTILIYNSDGILQYKVTNAFTKFCKEHGLPNRSFELSYKANGKRLYVQITNPKNPKFRFKGWYALKEIETH